MDTSILNIRSVSDDGVFICIEQHLSNFWSSIYEKLSSTEAELKNSVTFIRKKRVMDKKFREQKLKFIKINSWL